MKAVGNGLGPFLEEEDDLQLKRSLPSALIISSVLCA